eukprot:NODE_175_length_15885_cov_0.420563.p1 type:complete len:583 gc:universal NODE_175_length_15885_cov_0.420563:5815-7563(+)
MSSLWEKYIFTNDVSACMNLVNKGQNVDEFCIDWIGSKITPIMYAAARDRLQIVELLSQNTGNINLQSSDGWTALICACFNSRVEIVKFLLPLIKTIDLPSKYGRTALSHTKSKDIAKMLIQHGASTKGKLWGSTVLIKDHFADVMAEVDLDLKNIITLKDLNHYRYKQSKTFTPWNDAIHSKDEGLVVYLLEMENGSLVNEIFLHENRYVTPLLCACYANKMNLIDLFLNNGALDFINLDWDSIIMQLIQSKTIEREVYQRLLREETFSSSLTSSNRHGKTPLILAILNANIFMVATLLSFDAISDTINDQVAGMTPLTYAMRAGKEFSIDLILQHPKLNKSLLKLEDELKSNNPMCVGLMIKNKIPCTNDSLIYAVENEVSVEIIQLLIDNGQYSRDDIANAMMLARSDDAKSFLGIACSRISLAGKPQADIKTIPEYKTAEELKMQLDIDYAEIRQLKDKLQEKDLEILDKSTEIAKLKAELESANRIIQIQKLKNQDRVASEISFKKASVSSISQLNDSRDVSLATPNKSRISIFKDNDYKSHTTLYTAKEASTADISKPRETANPKSKKRTSMFSLK